MALRPNYTASSRLISNLQKVSSTPQAQVIPEPTLNKCPLILLPSVLMQYRLGPFSSTPDSMRPICSPYLLQWLMRLTMIRDAAATDGSQPCLSQKCLTCWESQAYQNWQSAAPPAIVASFLSLISMTFLTFSEEMKLPIVALESTAIMIPSLNTKARVVVPVLKSIILLSPPLEFLTESQNSQGLSIAGSMISWSNYQNAQLSSLAKWVPSSGSYPPNTWLYIQKYFKLSSYYQKQCAPCSIPFTKLPKSFINEMDK